MSLFLSFVFFFVIGGGLMDVVLCVMEVLESFCVVFMVEMSIKKVMCVFIFDLCEFEGRCWKLVIVCGEDGDFD